MNIGRLLRTIVLPVMLARCSATITSQTTQNQDPCAPDVIGSSANYVRGVVLVGVEGREISVTPEGSPRLCQINIDTREGTYGPIPLEVDINSPQMRECLNRPIMAAASGEPVRGDANVAARVEACIEHLLHQ
jgi:hypothetical protein